MIALVIPALNEGEVIGEVVRSIPAITDRIIVVDNGSADDTAKRAEEAGRFISKQLTPKEIEEAEQQALQWLSRLKKIPPMSDPA